MEDKKIMQSAIEYENFVDVVKTTLVSYQLQFAIAISLFLIIITTVIFLKSRRSKGNALVLMGMSDAGKTALFIQLVHKKFMETYTSMIENRSYFHLEDAHKKLKSIELIDVPGYDKLRLSIFEKVKYSTRAIIFVVDGASFSDNTKDVVECLYCLLIDEHIRSKKIPILVACNKSDVDSGFSCKEVVKVAVEKEINHLRQTRAAALQSTDGKTYSTPFVGKRSKDFSFEDDRNMRVSFADVSVKNNLDELKQWVLKTFV